MNIAPLVRLASIAIAGTCAAGLWLPEPAQAWHAPGYFPVGSPWRAGGGNYYTGSPRSFNFDCAACHVGAEQIPPSERFSLDVSAERVVGQSLQPYDLFGQGYVPGEQYRISAAFVGEHRGHAMADGSYEDPGGTPEKVSCPNPAPGNHNHFTAEVFTDDEVYATHAGNAAGQLRPDADSNLGPTASGGCALPPTCGGQPGGGGGMLRPMNEGGASTLMTRHWALVDPNANPPLGEWGCGECDALHSNIGWDTPANENEPFSPVVYRFFWTAPSTPPAAAEGRVRFYMSAVDGDGYNDAVDDDVLNVRLAACPQGNGACETEISQVHEAFDPPAATPAAGTSEPAGPGGSGPIDGRLWMFGIGLLGAVGLRMSVSRIRHKRGATA